MWIRILLMLIRLFHFGTDPDPLPIKVMLHLKASIVGLHGYRVILHLSPFWATTAFEFGI
jgi:hypothetical protein